MIAKTTITETTQVKMQLALKKQFQQWLFNRTSIISLIVLVPTHLCLAKTSGLFSFADGSSAIWPSSGVFLAALMLFGPKVWLPIFISDWIVCQTLFYHALPTSLLISIIDTAEVIGASLLMLHFVKRSYPFDRIASTLKYLLRLIPMPLVSSGLAVAVLSLLGISEWSDFWPVYRGWLCGVLAGEVVITPFLLSTWYSFKSRRWRLTDIQLIEFLIVLVLLFVIGLVTFAGTAPIEYVLIFPLIWSAIRFGPRESTFLALAMSVFSIYQTLHGHGSFAQSETAAAAVLLQSFIAAMTIATLVLSAAIQENRQANGNLREINEDLEHRVERRTEELTQISHHSQ
ncbi:MAG: hypothetical protein DCF15_08890 [Phormidesmis priestleyi]|uniref:MASE1 domain-containing protein n=1 Tax=Phormidesmis priestleyi TaxID=268141 RepID=A0A2W4ZCC9_9CYAN|nr:MAG: hypothetical protein DCF15_08890 [Phormidesmis priestleyi]